MLCTNDLKNHYFNKVHPWGSILQEITKAILSTYHISNKISHSQLVFGRCMLFNIAYIPNWEDIRAQKQLLTNKNTIRENK